MGEHDYDLAGARFALRSTSTEFMAAMADTLAPYRTRPAEPSWPLFSVVAPTGTDRGGSRQLHVGYLNHGEAFRYAGAPMAQAALLAAIDTAGRRQLAARCVPLDAEALVIDGQGVLVYGPRAPQWRAELVAHGAAKVSWPTALVDLGATRLASWPLRVTQRPTSTDRRGVRLAPLAQLVEASAGTSFDVGAVVRAASGRATAGDVVAELLSRTAHTGAPLGAVFRALACIVGQAVLVTGRRTPKAISRLLADLQHTESDVGEWSR